MALVDYSVGRKERAFAKVETVPLVFEGMTTSDGIRLHGSFSIGKKKTRLIEDDKRANESPVNSYDTMEATEWQMPEGNLRPSGSLASEPEMGVLLYALLGAKTTPNKTTTVNAGTGTTTGATLASAVGLAAGDLVRFATTTFIRRLVTVNTGTGAVTWYPALAAAPADGATVTSGSNYKPIADPTITLSLVRDMHHTVEYFPGCWVNEASIKFAKNGWLRASFSGAGAGKRARVANTLLNGGIDGVVTSLAVTAGDGRMFDISDGEGVFIQIDSEILKITARSTDTMTVTRGVLGSSAAAHSNGAEITPYVPSPTLVGSAVTGIRGFFYTVDTDGDSTPRLISFDTAEIKIVNAFQRRDEYGSEFAVGFHRSDPTRLVTFNAALKFRRQVNFLRDAADAGRKVGLVLSCGETSGSIMAVVIPRLRFDADPVPEAPANGDQMVTLTGTAYASDNNTEDAITIGSI